MGDPSFEIDTSLYTESSVRKAAHKFLGRYFVRMERSKPDSLSVSLVAKPGVEQTSTLVEEFFNEVMEYDLRERIARETEPFTNLILAHAFSKLPIIETPSELADFEDDPEGISKVPG
jgi:His-Xaa-Ser system protein HxsD